ncbi:MAG: SufD family Fe-S cluster assembly protein [Wenzhouxiangellaceae bacterium]|nr:SufD family Fe-S cluster assembly protein [Wenzhouxiangellaceae bacterium]
MGSLNEKLLAPSVETGDGFDALRRQALKVLMQHGFPHRKVENWKYTPLSLLEKRAFAQADAPQASWPAAEVPAFAGGLIHLHDGRLDPARCCLPDGLRLEPLTPADVDTDALDQTSSADAFAWLNIARLGQAWRLTVEASIADPIWLVETFSAAFADAVHPHLVVELAPNVELTLVQSQTADGAGLVNGVLEIELAEGARLRHLIERASGETARIQRTRARIAGRADYRAFVLDGGGALTRQELILELEGADAHGGIHGAALLHARSLVDYHTAINHRVGPSTSEEDFRILADDAATGVFNGRILIVPGADGSDSRMNTGNLLLSDSARINTKPELEIHAEEVSASHGATIGQLDDTARFYLRSRGLSDTQAIALLKYGFAAAAFDGFADGPLGDWLIARLKQHLGDDA